MKSKFQFMCEPRAEQGQSQNSDKVQLVNNKNND